MKNIFGKLDLAIIPKIFMQMAFKIDVKVDCGPNNNFHLLLCFFFCFCFQYQLHNKRDSIVTSGKSTWITNSNLSQWLQRIWALNLELSWYLEYHLKWKRILQCLDFLANSNYKNICRWVFSLSSTEMVRSQILGYFLCL